jgi:hypothetical protein
MKNATRYFINLAAAVLLVIASATIAAAFEAGSDTCAGLNATIGNTCVPLTNQLNGSSNNSAFGANALFSNIEGTSPTSGFDNTAIGAYALTLNTFGFFNTAIGVEALQSNTTGIFNIGVGNGAGKNLTTGSNNIDIYDPGVAGEANTIRIGSQGTQSATFIAGIFGGPTMKKGCDVMADSAGLLGCAKSSARYKRDIRDMGDASDKLMKLRPVIFQYKEDSEGTPQYGLIAEEVEKVYPELVIEGNDGRPETVEYQVLPAMLLNELPKEVRDNDRQTAQIAKLSRQIEEMKARHDKELGAMRAAFEDRVSRIEREMAARDGGRNIAATFSR